MYDPDRSNRTLTVGQLIEQLSRLDPNLPVVMSQEDDPLGDYGVRSVGVDEMQRESTYSAEPFGMDVYHEGPAMFDFRDVDGYHDAPGPVAFLSKGRPYLPTIEAEPQQFALPASD